MLLPTLVGLSVVLSVFAGPYSDPTCASGRHTIVHLFEWKWTDIAEECERFLGPYGYCGVQISPPNENRIVTNPNRPWWERYQPVSYKLVTRSGTETELKDMINRCNNVDVRIYADVVMNHMTGAGGSGMGTAGSHWDGDSLSYPGVPFSTSDFNGNSECHTGDLNIHNYQNPEEVRNCRLVSLTDLKLSKDYVREKIAEYFNHLIDIGVGGFRIDAAKHMWPGDITNIIGRLHNLNTKYFRQGTRPFVYQEVNDQGGEPIKATEYLQSGRVTNFMYGLKLAQVMRKQTQAKWLGTSRKWGEKWGMPSTYDVVVFIDNHDNQRGYGGGGDVLTHFEPKLYKLATAFMLAHPYGFARIMSSYNWNRHFVNGTDQNSWIGPPHNGDMSTKNVSVNSDITCGNGWVCEHRWRQIYNMVAFRNVVMGTYMQYWWDNGDYQIAFGRGDKGYIVLNLQGSNLDTTVETGLPEGTYCDVISGNFENNKCTGETITVGIHGEADFHIDGNSNNPMIAIHVGAKLGSKKKVTT